MPPPSPPHPPGSFTKNFGWGGSGLLSLHQAINAGFRSKLAEVSRDDWRAACGLSDTNFYIAANFFLHNLVRGRTNVVPVDEFVRQAVMQPYSRAFDRLGLFVLNLSLGGKRQGVNGAEYPAWWANEFVRQSLWQAGQWQRSALDEAAMDAFLDSHIKGVVGARQKCRSNYRHLFELAGYLGSDSPEINTGIESWAAPALFTAWDRRALSVQPAVAVLPPNSLVSASEAEEDYKLLGITLDEFRALALPIAEQYSAVGGLARFSAPGTASPAVASAAPHSLTAAGAPTLAAAAGSPTSPAPVDPADLSWLTEAGSDAAVERLVAQRLGQKRNQLIATKLKAHYGYACMVCGGALLIGVNPDKRYAEAAHIKPLGAPHNGPDKPGNLLVLCPNHHLQLDRGILSLEKEVGGTRFISRDSGDPVHRKPVILKPPHMLDDTCVQWHTAFFAGVAE